MDAPEKVKLRALAGSEWAPHRYDCVFWNEHTTSGQRIVAAVSQGQIEIALRLAAALAGPFKLLWVLHTPRGGSNPGRYESSPVTSDEMQRVLREYAALFERDGRGDLWIHSRNPSATIVIDRHDLLFAYGPLELFVEVLRAMDFTEGHALIPSPHAHEYHPEFDEMERALARELEWAISELRAEDEQ